MLDSVAVPLPGYTLDGVLGHGPLGTVYLGHSRDGTAVAIKVCPTSGAGFATAARIENEAEVLYRLRHPHIARFIACGRRDGVVYLVTELVGGPSLARVLDTSGRLTFPEVAEIGLALAEALTCAHELTDPAGQTSPVIHRDLKPGNVVLSLDGEARLIDFGIAKAAFRPWQLSRPGELKGTPRYMAPEQVLVREGESGWPVGPHTDLYALALLVYTLATGAALFDAPDVMGLLRQVRAGEVMEPLVALLETDCAPLVPILKRALKRQPQSRFASARQMADALRMLGVDRTTARQRLAHRCATIPMGTRDAARARACLGEELAPAPDVDGTIISEALSDETFDSDLDGWGRDLLGG